MKGRETTGCPQESGPLVSNLNNFKKIYQNNAIFTPLDRKFQ